MHIIGTKSYMHDQSFCYIKDGEVLFFVEEERFSRRKKSWHYNFEGLQYIIDKFKIKPEDAVLLNTYTDMTRFALAGRCRDFWYGAEGASTRTQERIREIKEILISRHLLSTYGFKNTKILDGIDHHSLHAASAFFPSPFERSAILSIDGSGDGDCGMIAHGIENRIEPKVRLPQPHSIGDFYSYITIWMCLGGVGDEGKTMGAASYGDWKRHYDLFREKLIDYDDQGFFICKYREMNDFLRVLGPGRSNHPEQPITQNEFDVAATAQKITEDIIFGLARRAKQITREKYLCMAGGVALNSVANGKLLASGLFDDLWVQPVANDAGLSVGGALWNYYVTENNARKEVDGKKSWWVQNHMYWGPEYSDTEIEDALREFGLPIQKVSNIEAWTAKKIHENNIVGWFQGKIEVGPRALGNRSILANATHPDMKDIVNQKVKFREPWRPFAPSVLEEDCSVFFDSNHPSPYMILVYNVKEEWRAKLPSITHVDGTARVQTVSKLTNPRYHSMIQEYKKLSGVGMVLNTSFNIGGEPIVLNPRQAIIDFLRTKMDALVLHDYVLEKTAIPAVTKFFPTRHSPHYDSIAKLRAGHYLFILVPPSDPKSFNFLGSMFFMREFKKFTLDTVCEQPDDINKGLIADRDVIKNVYSLSDDLGALPTRYDGIILCASFYHQLLDSVHGDANVKLLRELVHPVEEKNSGISVHLFDLPSGILGDFNIFAAATEGVQSEITKVLADEKSAPFENSDLYSSLVELRKRFRAEPPMAGQVHHNLENPGPSRPIADPVPT